MTGSSAARSDDLEISASRRIPASPARVWACLTTAREIEGWWNPEDLRTSVRRFVARSGGAVEIHVQYRPALFTPDHTKSFEAVGIPISFDLRGTCREVVAERRLELDLRLEIGRAGAAVAMVTRFEIAPAGDGSEVRVVGSGRDTPHWRSLGQQNLEGQLERLARAATG